MLNVKHVVSLWPIRLLVSVVGSTSHGKPCGHLSMGRFGNGVVVVVGPSYNKFF